MPLRVFWRCSGAVAAFVLISLIPSVAAGQGDSSAIPGIRIPASWRPRLPFIAPPQLTPIGRATFSGVPSQTVAAEAAAAFREALIQREKRLIENYRFQYRTDQTAEPLPIPIDSMVAEVDTSLAGRINSLIGDRLGVNMVARFESKLERSRNERCNASQIFSFTSQCEAGFQPTFDLQFQVYTSGVVADRLHINVNYDSEREFDSSNNINLFFQGKTHEFIDRLEFGNISLQLPPTQLITSNIPAGNFGVQATGQLGPLRYRGIYAQQKGNIPKTYEVVVGDRTVRAETRELEDYQFQARRFFFTVDPALFGAQYPNIDLLNTTQMRALAASIPENMRPSKIRVYKAILNGQAANQAGPQFQIIGRNEPRGQIYQLLVENRDYYTDPSNLWIALPQQLNLEAERLVIAYYVKVNGRDTVIADIGGTPDIGFTTAPQFAHLLWEPGMRSTDPAFRREIRSFYQIAGEDLRRSSVALRILTGGGEGQERPLSGSFDTYLQLFGMSQLSSSSLFDVENRVWPRPGDPNRVVTADGTTNAKIIRDYFVSFPSVRPFARDGLVSDVNNPSNDTIYAATNADLYSNQHPPSKYRLSLRYDMEGGSNVGMIQVNSVQLRRGSETVMIDGIPIARDTAYTIDYELGTITFMRPDTLFPPARTRRVSVRFEENPLFAAAPTSIMAFSGIVPVERGEFGLTFISQNQATTFTRPPLGLEPQSSLIAGFNGRLNFEVSSLSRLLEKLPTVENTTLSHADLNFEFATSRPQPNKAGQAYVETFESDGGLGLPLAEAAWHYGSQPALGLRLPQRFGGPETFGLARASTMAWQGAGLSQNGAPIQFLPSDIDPQLTFTRTGITAPEPILWLTLYPLSIGGLYSEAKRDFQWKIDNQPSGRRWRSVVTSLGAAGADLSRVEYITFFTLVDTTTAGRASNPSIIIDLGDISENSVTFGPDALNLVTNNGTTDSVFTGKAFMGLDRLNTERDPLTRSFNQEINDTGLPADVVPFMNLYRNGLFDSVLENVVTCSRGAFRILLLGDANNNCTVQNGRLDEEDLDGDNTLNMLEQERESERVRRYIVDLSNPNSYARVGGCTVAAVDTIVSGSGRRCWVQVRLPFGTPDDSTSGGPNVRRIRAARITVLSGLGAQDSAFTYVPFAQLKFQGSALVKRSQTTVRGIAGDSPAQGFTIASVIGTQDRDTLRNVDYEPPPGVSDEAERTQTGLENMQTVINEKSLRLLAGNLQQYERAEAFLRFPEGARNFMTYRELRVWARGRGNGWGQDGDLEFFIKIGRDAHNFYMYRTPVNGGPGRAAWLPEVVVDFDKLFELRRQLQNSVLRATPDSIACTGVDSILIARSGLPIGQPINRHAACSDGYMVYSVDPLTSPPSLSQVQELAVGMVRVGNGGGATTISPTDTLELWVDDVRLTDVENTPGYAGVMNFALQAGDIANFRLAASKTDAHFRQLTQTPSFLANDGLDVASSVRLEKLLPGALAYSIPLTIGYSQGSSEPLFLSQTDIPAQGIIGLRTPRSEVSRYSVSFRRIVPMRNSVWGVLLNNLYATANMSRAESRSEFSEGGSNVWNAGVDYNIQANPRAFFLPGWLTFGRDEPTAFRWNPTSFHVSTEIGKLSDNRRSFRGPVEIDTDTGRIVTGINHVLRTVTSIAFRPLNPLSFNADFSSTRDLRDYGDTSATSIIASLEREKLFGMDIGLERERTVNSSLQLDPALLPYFRPSLRIQTTSYMQRDPQSRQLVRTGDSTGAFRLPRRMSNGQTFGAGAQFEPSGAFRSWFGEESRPGKVANLFDPIRIDYMRSLSSSYDAAAFAPGGRFSFALGGPNRFLQHDGFAATIASVGNNVSLDGGFRIGNNFTVSSRTLFTETDNYTKRLDNTLGLIQGRQRVLPDIRVGWRDSLNWLKRIAWGDSLSRTRPFGWLRVISTVDLNVNTATIRSETFAPAEAEGAPDQRITLTKTLQPTVNVNWADNGAMNTQIQWSKTQRVDSVPGSFTRTNTSDVGFNVSRSFRMPARWKMRSRMRAGLTWSKSRSSSYISVIGSGEPSRLADNGTTRWDVRASSDLMPNLGFQLQASQSVSFDNNYNRKFSQFFLTAQFTFRFQTGELR